MADSRPSRYVEGDKVIYRASALGLCVKALTALGIGMTPDDHPAWLLEKFQQGIDGESVVIDMLKPNWRIVDSREGHQYNWHDGQILVEVPVGTRVVIRGHADAIGTCYKAPVYEHGSGEWRAGEKRLIEVKCTTEDYGHVVLKKLPMMYQVQITTYASYFDLPAMLALGIKDGDGKVVNVVTKMIDPLPMTMGQVKQRVMEIEGWIETGELPRCDYRQWPCQFPWLCDEQWEPGTPDHLLMQQLEESIVMVNQRKGKGRVDSGAS